MYPLVSHRPRPRRVLAAVAALALAAGLSACGDDSDAAAGEPAAELRLGFYANVTHATALAGVDQKLIEKELGSTKLKTQVFNAGPAAVEALFAGALDATYIGPNPAIN